jgi:hypothetical protein
MAFRSIALMLSLFEIAVITAPFWKTHPQRDFIMLGINFM